MDLLATPFQIGSMLVPNRLVRSATHEGLADHGQVTAELIEAIVRLAQGQVGTIVTGESAIAPDGGLGGTQIGLWHDETVSGLSKMADAVHAASASRLVVQISHAGPNARGTTEPVAPSAVHTLALPAPPRALLWPEIEEILEAFAETARRVKEAGVDGVQFHMCHGDLPSSFLSKITNRRLDQWGGSLDNRMRFSLEMVRRARVAVGPDYPLLAKISATDFKGGWKLEDAQVLAQALVAEGIDAVEVSAGTSETWPGMSRGEVPVDMIAEGLGGGWLKRWTTTLYFASSRRRFAFQEAYLMPEALAIKDVIVDTPVIAVGGFRTVQTMEMALLQGIDLVALSRPLIREPDLVRRMLAGETDRSTCRNCNRCVIAVDFQGKPLQCYCED
jgi:2,4-dienoyl-CoA reductase-like NADH-dependent reductase (Old Yellow Enzyme family)